MSAITNPNDALRNYLLVALPKTEFLRVKSKVEFLSINLRAVLYMPGVRREAVNKSATVFQQNGLISYKREKVLILDRAGLEAAACRCYFIIREEL